jgi:cyclophilin family peptidyl-prolyl cis-trans isomerase
MRSRSGSKRTGFRAWIERLEPRHALAVSVLNPFPDLALSTADGPHSLTLAGRFDDAAVTGTVVRFATNVAAPFDQFFVELFDADGPGRSRTTPGTAANFLSYVDAGRYANTFIHRSVPGFVIQTGGYALENGLPHIETFAPIQNEFGTSNTRGTVAMAKLGSDAPGGGPDSATSEWFVNLADNSANLDAQNGGFTAFGRILGTGMSLFDAIATQVPRYDIRSATGNGALNETPLLNIPNPVPADLQLSVGNFLHFPRVERVGELAISASSSDATLVTPSFVTGPQGPALRIDRAPGKMGTAVVTVRVASVFDPQDFVEDQFSVVIQMAPSPPSDIVLSAAAVAENLPAGMVVGTFSSVDPNPGQSHAYSLVSGDGSADNAAFAIAGGVLTTATAFNFEAKRSYSIRVRSTDQGGLSAEKAFTIMVTDINEAPTDIALSAATVAENRPAGTTVGTFTTTDPDVGNAFAYSLVPGDGSADNATFAIAGGVLTTATAFNFEAKRSYSIRVRSTDLGGLSTEKAFTITVSDVADEPLIVDSITPSAAGSYKAGEVVTFTMNLSATATVTGKPQIAFRLGAATRRADYAAGSGTSRLAFQYRVGSKDNAEQVSLASALVVSTRNVIAAGGARLAAALPPALANAVLGGLRFDAIAPKAAGAVQVPAAGRYAAGQALNIVVTFTENVFVGGPGLPSIVLSGLTGGPRQAVYASGSGTSRLTFRYVVQPGDAVAGKKGMSLAKAISLNGGSIIDRDGKNAATLRLPNASLRGVTITAGGA